MTRVDNITAFLIHSRNYQNNSKLLDFLTDDFGKIRLVARGIKNSKIKIQPFLKLKITFSGKGELKTLNNWEIDDKPRYLVGGKLLIMIYINELVVRLIASDKISLCADYLYLLEHLEDDIKNNEWQLRLFENKLLSQLGFSIDCYYAIDGIKIINSKNYNFIINQGFSMANKGILGEQLLLVAKGIMPNLKALNFYKKVNRERIKVLLGGRELKSRKLFYKKIPVLGVDFN